MRKLLVVLSACLVVAALAGLQEANAVTYNVDQENVVNPGSGWSGWGVSDVSLHWRCMEFTPTQSELAKVEVLIDLKGTGNLTVELREDAGGYPEAAALTSATIPASSIVAKSWNAVAMPYSGLATDGTSYWFVFYGNTGAYWNGPELVIEQPGDYPGGAPTGTPVPWDVPGNLGITWEDQYFGGDYAFRTYYPEYDVGDLVAFIDVIEAKLDDGVAPSVSEIDNAIADEDILSAVIALANSVAALEAKLDATEAKLDAALTTLDKLQNVKVDQSKLAPGRGGVELLQLAP